MALIVEVLRPGRAGEVRERVRLGDAPLTIGRALDNGLVLDDPHVDAHHARLVRDPDGNVVLEDLGSVNRIDTTWEGRRDRVPVTHGTTVTLGRTTLRIRDEQAVVPAAIPLHAASAGAEAPARWHERTDGRAGIIAGALAIAAIDTWLQSTERGAASAVFGTLLVGAAMTIAWAGIWAIAGRVVLGQFRFLAHVTVVALAFAAFAVIDLLDGWSAFLFPSVESFALFQTFAMVGLLASLVAWHLGSATHLPRAQRWRIGAIAGVVVLSLLGVSALLEEEAFTEAASFSGVIKPLSTSLVPTESTEEFTKSITDLRGEIDSLLVARDR